MKKTIFLFAPLIILASVIRAQSSSTDLASAAVAKLDKAVSIKDFQQLAGEFEGIAASQKNQWLLYYYAAFCNAKIGWLKQEDPDNIEQYANKANAQIEKAIRLIDTATHKKEASEIYVVLSMIRRSIVYVNPMTYGKEYGIAATKYVLTAYHYNPTNPRALYLLGWEKYATPKQYGGDKVKAKEYLLQAKEQLQSNPATGTEPRWGKTEVDDILKKLK